jgi:hypothetical protein
VVAGERCEAAYARRAYWRLQRAAAP